MLSLYQTWVKLLHSWITVKVVTSVDKFLKNENDATEFAWTEQVKDTKS